LEGVCSLVCIRRLSSQQSLPVASVVSISQISCRVANRSRKWHHG